ELRRLHHQKDQENDDIDGEIDRVLIALLAFWLHTSSLHVISRAVLFVWCLFGHASCTVGAGCSRYPPASARSSTAPIASMSARAASTLSSTATRAPGPSASFTKSIFSACSSGASNGWSYDTFASRSLNHPCAPLPLPAMFTCVTIMVHIVVLLILFCLLQASLAKGKSLECACGSMVLTDLLCAFFRA